MLEWLRPAGRGDVFPFRVKPGPVGYAILSRAGPEISGRAAERREIRVLVVQRWNEAIAEVGSGVPR